MSWNEGFEGPIGAPRLKPELEYGSCGSDTNSDFLHFRQLQAAGCRGLYLPDLLSLFPYRHPDEIRNLTVFIATVCVASSGLRPVCRPLFGPLTSVDLFGNSRLRVGGGICGRCRLCSRTSEIAFGSPHLAEFSGQLVAFSVLFFLWCTLYFSIKQWQQATHAREQLAHDRKRLVQAAVSLPTGLPSPVLALPPAAPRIWPGGAYVLGSAAANRNFAG